MANEIPKIKNRVLIVDDDLVSREMLRFALEDEFDVSEATCGEDCLAAVVANPPQLVILDIEMPGIGGYETCWKLREMGSLPIIFVSSHDTLEERVEAFDSGANDFVIKPFDAEILSRKVKLAIEARIEHDKMTQEKNHLQKVAMDFLSTVGENGVLLEFVRQNLSCSDHQKLAANLLGATQQYGVECHVQIRHPNGNITLNQRGIATALEESVLDRCRELGRIFQFKNRMAINYNMVSIIVMNTPEDEVIAGRIRDNLCILAETAEAITETISARKNSVEKAEQLQSASINATLSIEEVRELYRAQQEQSRVLLKTLVEEVEKSYLFLGLTDKQESMVSQLVRKNVAPVLSLFDQTELMEQKFHDIINSMTNKKNGEPPEVWLF